MFPDNEAVVGVFIAMTTQWRIGMSGPTGLDYAALPAVLRLCAIPRAQHPDLFDDLRVMEAEALAYFGEQRQ